MKEIVLVFAGNKNFGDDAILDTWLKYYHDLYQEDFHITLLCDNREYYYDLLQEYSGEFTIEYLHFDVYNNAKEIVKLLRNKNNNQNVNNVIENIERFDENDSSDIGGYKYFHDNLISKKTELLEIIKKSMFVHFLGGGHINNLWDDIKVLFKLIATMCKNSNIKYFFTGQTIGPLSEDDKVFMSDTFRNASFIDIRDNGSLKYLKLVSNKVNISIDDVFINKNINCTIKEKHITLSLQDWDKIDEEKYHKLINKCLVQIEEKFKMDPNLKLYVVDCLDVESKYSEYIKENLSTFLKEKTFFTKSSEVGFRYVIELIQTSLLNISTRFHFAVYSLRANVNTISIILDEYYRLKIEGVHHLFNSTNYLYYQDFNQLDINNIQSFDNLKVNELVTKKIALLKEIIEIKENY